MLRSAHAVGVAAALAAVAAAVGGRGPSAPPPAPAAYIYGPPPGHTGGFGEPTCRLCHAEFELNFPGGQVELEGLPVAWIPGHAYPVVVSLQSQEMVVVGFQLSARFADGKPAGTLRPIGDRVVVVDSTGVPYAQQAPGGAAPETPETARWTLEWVAPASGGEVLFHAAANSANGDNSPLGDLIYATERRVPAGR